jgi:hypothetical protein
MRGVHIENLKRGDWIAIIGCRDEESGKVRDRQYTGRPSRVVSVCWPFICVDDGVTKDSIDTRYWRFTKVTSRYAMSVLEGRQNEPCPSCTIQDIYLVYSGNELVAECNTCEYSEPAVSFWKKTKRTGRSS